MSAPYDDEFPSDYTVAEYVLAGFFVTVCVLVLFACGYSIGLMVFS